MRGAYPGGLGDLPGSRLEIWVDLNHVEVHDLPRVDGILPESHRERPPQAFDNARPLRLKVREP